VGSSFAIIIPADEARINYIAEGDIVQVEIKRKLNLIDLFGSVKFSKSSQELADDDRKAWGD
jgi:hypothetical protein